MDEIELEKLKEHYAILTQIVDGLWYLEVEKELGFDKAYEIDEAVWERFSRKEAKRLKRLLGFENPSFEDIQKMLELAIFDQSLEFELIKEKEDPLTIRMDVSQCKTYRGMEKVGRPADQIYRICKGIGLAFFRNLLKAIVPETTVKCLFCPFGEGDEKIPEGSEYVCAWEFVLPLKEEKGD